MARRLSHTDMIKVNRMQTSPSCSAPSKIPADSTYDESQALKPQKSYRGVSFISACSVSQRNRATIASQDSQPITPGQRVHENESLSHSPQKTCYNVGSNAYIFLLNMLYRFP